MRLSLTIQQDGLKLWKSSSHKGQLKLWIRDRMQYSYLVDTIHESKNIKKNKGK